MASKVKANDQHVESVQPLPVPKNKRELGFEPNLNRLLAKHAPIRVNGKTASNATQQKAHDVLYAFFRVLYRLGYKVLDPKNLGHRHIQAVVTYWYYEKKKVPKSLQNDLSIIGKFCDWIGKPGLVKTLQEYLPTVSAEALKVTTYAVHSKGWSSNGLDLDAEFQRAAEVDSRLPYMLILAHALSLRRKEVIHCKIHVADLGDFLSVSEGKGGKPRLVRIDTPEKRNAVDKVKNFIKKKNESLGWPTTVRGKPATEKYCIERYRNLMTQLGFTSAEKGVTGHGLRAEGVENSSIRAGFLPAVFGGAYTVLSPDELKVVILQISDGLGHHRIIVYASYAGKLPRGLTPRDVVTQNAVMDAALLVLFSKGDIVTYDDIYHDEVLNMTKEMQDAGYAITPAGVYALWTIYSRRNGGQWVQPGRSVEVALLAAAYQVINVYAKQSCH